MPRYFLVDQNLSEHDMYLSVYPTMRVRGMYYIPSSQLQKAKWYMNSAQINAKRNASRFTQDSNVLIYTTTASLEPHPLHS